MKNLQLVERKQIRKILGFMIFVSFVLMACNPESNPIAISPEASAEILQTQTPSHTITISSTILPTNTNEASLTPTITLTPTNSPTPTNTPTDTPTAIPTPTLRPTDTPISVAEALNNPDIPVITSENIKKLQHVANFVIGRKIQDVFWSPDGTKLIFVNSWKGVDIYSFSFDKASLQNTQNISTWDTVSFAISPDGSQIVKQNNQGQFEIFDTTNQQMIQVIGDEVKNSLGADIAWGPKMDVLATMFSIPLGWDAAPEIRLYSLLTGEQTGAFSNYGILQTYGLNFSPGGTLLATTSLLDGNTYVWNLSTGNLAFSVFGNNPSFSSDGKMIATRSLGKVLITSVSDASQIALLDAPLRDNFDYSETTFVPDNSLVVTTGKDLIFWRIADREKIAGFGAHEPYTHAVFHPKGKLLVTIRGEDKDTRVIIWAVLP